MALKKLGPFDLIRVLGRGGMGTVYEACETGSDCRVAVKALAPQFSFDDRFRHRFEGEIDALMKLEHRNIVRLLSYGQDEGNLFFAMELVDGCSLFQEQKKGQVFHWREIVEIGVQVCDGLRHAHDRGIIHRDLKPGNLMIDADRCVKITDFGIAKSFGSSSMTREGNVLGTMDFMAPEQARGEAVTVRSDLFSLGAVMYALLAGRPPFVHDSVDKTFDALLSADPPVPLTRVASDTPVQLASLIHRLLEKDPGKRLATAMACGRQLRLVEEAVQDSPDAKTQVVPAEPDKFEIELGETFSTGGVRSGALTFGDETGSSTLPKPESQEPQGQSIEESVSRQPDYFNQVTQQQRNKSFDSGLESADPPPARKWPLVLGLAVVLGLGAAGIWYSVIRQPGPDELLATIRKNDRSPTRVQNELAQFVRNYPEHPAIDYVRELQAFSAAQRFRNTLQLKQNSPRSSLSPIEQQFLEITALGDRDIVTAQKQMHAFLLFHGDNRNLSRQDERTLEAARVYADRMKQKAAIQIQKDDDAIRDGMLRAEESSSNRDKLDRYEFIVDTYGKYEWAAPYIDRAREEITRIKSELNNQPPGPQVPDEPTPGPSR